MDGNPSKDVTYKYGMVYNQGSLWIPESRTNNNSGNRDRNQDLRCEIWEAEHNLKVAGHMGMDKAVEIIRRNCFWAQGNSYIEDHFRSCDSCQRNNAARYARYELLLPMEPAYAPRQFIPMDFITDPLSSSAYTSIWVIMHRFTKMAHFIPLENGLTKLADLPPSFSCHIWPLHGIPEDVVAETDGRFTSAIWTELC